LGGKYNFDDSAGYSLNGFLLWNSLENFPEKVLKFGKTVGKCNKLSKEALN